MRSRRITSDNASPQPVSVLGAAEVEARYGVDLTTAEVIRHALEHIGLQMQIKINTAALSPLLSEVNDFGIGLLAPRDLERNLTSMRSQWVPRHQGTM